jgi:glycosyltransferase involved in cell wall biosynthesis
MKQRNVPGWVRAAKSLASYGLPPALAHPRAHLKALGKQLLKLFVPRVFFPEGARKFARAVGRRWAGPDRGDAELLAVANDAAFGRGLRWAYVQEERTPAEIRAKAALYRGLLGTSVGRTSLYQAIGRLERLAGDELVAALYAVRAMRLDGGDTHGDLPWVLPALRRHGYAHEADAVAAMYGPPADRDGLCAALLGEAFDRNRNAPAPCAFEAYHDRRDARAPLVSVIVSLYNAAPKLLTFLKALRPQTLLRAGRLELILVDSGSPADEFAPLRHPAAADLPVLYVRTPERETIQTAWNRGVALARAPYLAFLGADETVTPTAYEELAAVLDARPEVDWVIADSLVTDVDAHGNPSQDVLAYDRRGYCADLVALETCYLSWVGGLYRKSLHDRFGYYDGSFRAAGDTEFKGRVLPFITTCHLPRMLGVFLNYPEERTTASPRAELEDLRAWYLHRTPAGIRRTFAARDVGELERAAARALGYRKSYCEHLSSDAEYAHAALEVLRGRAPDSRMLALADGTARLLAAYRAADRLPGMRDAPIRDNLLAAARAAAGVRDEHRRTEWLPHAAPEFFHDNRYEQHTHPW